MIDSLDYLTDFVCLDEIMKEIFLEFLTKHPHTREARKVAGQRIRRLMVDFFEGKSSYDVEFAKKFKEFCKEELINTLGLYKCIP